LTDLIADPFTWLLIGAITGTALVAGLVRREPRRAIVLMVVGAGAFALGLAWAGRLGAEPSYAAFLATAGFAIWETAAGLARRTEARAARE
jgi:hypothetical protein